MKFFQKLKSFFNRKNSKVEKVIGYSPYGEEIFTPNDYENFAKECYLKNPIAFRAILEVASNTSSVPWNLYRSLPDNKREIVEDHYISKLLLKPNPNESFQFLMLKATAYLVLAGNSFVEKVSPLTGPNKDKVKELYVHRPDRFSFKLDKDGGQLEQYIYTNLGQKVHWDVDPITKKADILHLKSFHPVDDWWGAAPTESVAREIDTSNSMIQWNKSLLNRGARPGLVFTLIGTPGEQFLDQMQKQLENNYGSPDNAGRNIIISGDKGTNVSPYSWSPKDLDFSDGDLALCRKIAISYGVPPMLLGIPGESTFANYKEAREAFFEQTIVFYLNYLKEELNNWFFQEDEGLFLDFNLDKIPAFSNKRDKMWERAEKSNFITINEKREMVGLPAVPEGNVILVSNNLVPLNEDGIGEEEEEEIRDKLKKYGYKEDEIDQMLGYNV
jgi:HK97 family phage portal protein